MIHGTGCFQTVCLHLDDVHLEIRHPSVFMLLTSTFKASAALMRLLLFFTLSGSCFAFDEMIVEGMSAA